MKKINKVFLIAFLFCICIIAIPNKALADNQRVNKIEYYVKNDYGNYIPILSTETVSSDSDLEIRVEFNSKLKDNEIAKISLALTDTIGNIHNMCASFGGFDYCYNFKLEKYPSYEKKYYVRIGKISGDCLSYEPHVSIRKNSWEEGRWEEQDVDGDFRLTINDELTVKDCYIIKNNNEDRTVLFR